MTDQDPLVAHHVTAEDATALTTAVDKLRREVHSRSVGFLIALTLIAALGIIVAVLLRNQSAQNARLEASIHEQCSLYGLVIPSYRDAARAASPLGPDGYDNAYRQMQTSADHLNCGIPHKVPGT